MTQKVKWQGVTDESRVPKTYVGIGIVHDSRPDRTSVGMMHRQRYQEKGKKVGQFQSKRGVAAGFVGDECRGRTYSEGNGDGEVSAAKQIM